MSEQHELSNEELLQRYGSIVRATDPGVQRSPFKFLDSYELQDSRIFFGRDTEITELIHHFRQFGHLVVYGKSGCGKTSLVQCGLRSRIPAADALFIPLRIRPGGIAAACQEVGEEVTRQTGIAAEVPADWDLVRTLKEASHAVSRPIVLFLDQFEELFILHEQPVREAFARQLDAILRQGVNAKVIIGIRQDYLAYLTETEQHASGLFDNRYWLRRMSREKAAMAAVEACGVCRVGIDEVVPQAIARQLDAAGHGVELPYFQVVMDRLYRRALAENSLQPEITAEALDRVGDIADILGDYLIDEIAQLPNPDTGRQLLKAFVTQDGTRRPLSLEEAVQESRGFGAKIETEDAATHLARLATARILKELPEQERFELRHDALALTVAGWITDVENDLMAVRDSLVNRYDEYAQRSGEHAGLLDEDFLEYLGVYRKRLDPLIDPEVRQFLLDSEKHLSRQQRRRRLILGSTISAAFVVLAAFTTVVLLQLRAVQQGERDRAKLEVGELTSVAAVSVPYVIRKLNDADDYRDLIIEQLVSSRSPDTSNRNLLRIGAALAVIDADHVSPRSIVEDEWSKLRRAPAQEYLSIMRALKPFRTELEPLLTRRLDSSESTTRDRLRIVCALATYSPDHERWSSATFGDSVVSLLYTADPLELYVWINALRGVRDSLKASILRNCRVDPDHDVGPDGAELRAISMQLYAELFRDRLSDLADEVAKAEPGQLRALLPRLRPEVSEQLIRALEQAEDEPLVQANIAVALLRLRRREADKYLVAGDENTVRTEIIHRLCSAEVDPQIVVQRLGDATGGAPDAIQPMPGDPREASLLAGFLLALGEYSPKVFGHDQQEAITPRIVELYETHPDSGVHAAARWVLQKWGRNLTNPSAKKYDSGSNWFVFKDHTLAVVTIPAQGNQAAHRYAVSTHEVTRSQFEAFLAAMKSESIDLGFNLDDLKHEDRNATIDVDISPTDNCPAQNMSWTCALLYCNWLSRQEGLQPFYTSELPRTIDQSTVRIQPGDRSGKRLGYRLPTEEEWGWASRGGAAQGPHFGAERRYWDYAWYVENAENRAWPVGTLKPNAFGLFDSLGSVSEWCLNRADKDAPEAEVIGGSYDYDQPIPYSSLIDSYLVRGYPNIGFRIARTIDPDE